MNQNTINIVIAINHKYVRYAYVMLTSLLMHHTIPVDVYVMYRDLDTSDMNTLQELSRVFSVSFHFIYIPDSLLPPAELLSASSWGIEAYFRLAIVDLLPTEIERALYLDTDIIINNSITDLYFCDFNGNKLAACKEFYGTPPFHNYRDELFHDFIPNGFSYFNSGVVLYNMKALYPNSDFKMYMNLAKKLNYKVEFPDQDLLNYCHHDEVLLFDTFQYNLNARYAFVDYQISYEQLKRDSVIVHYASSKPWRSNFLHCETEQLWWDYAKKTPFFHEFQVEILQELLTDNSVNAYIANLVHQNSVLYQRIEFYDQLLKEANILSSQK